MFIELFITDIVILNYHREICCYLDLKKIEIFAFKQKFTEKYLMQILNAKKA